MLEAIAGRIFKNASAGEQALFLAVAALAVLSYLFGVISAVVSLSVWSIINAVLIGIIFLVLTLLLFINDKYFVYRDKSLIIIAYSAVMLLSSSLNMIGAAGVALVLSLLSLISSVVLYGTLIYDQLTSGDGPIKYWLIYGGAVYKILYSLVMIIVNGAGSSSVIVTLDVVFGGLAFIAVVVLLLYIFDGFSFAKYMYYEIIDAGGKDESLDDESCDDGSVHPDEEDVDDAAGKTQPIPKVPAGDDTDEDEEYTPYVPYVEETADVKDDSDVEPAGNGIQEETAPDYCSGGNCSEQEWDDEVDDTNKVDVPLETLRGSGYEEINNERGAARPPADWEDEPKRDLLYGESVDAPGRGDADDIGAEREFDETDITELGDTEYISDTESGGSECGADDCSPPAEKEGAAGMESEQNEQNIPSPEFISPTELRYVRFAAAHNKPDSTLQVTGMSGDLFDVWVDGDTICFLNDLTQANAGRGVRSAVIAFGDVSNLGFDTLADGTECIVLTYMKSDQTREIRFTKESFPNFKRVLEEAGGE